MSAATAFAQGSSTTAERTTLSGFVDAYYAYNFNHPATPCAVVDRVQVFNCLHAFDVAQRSFSLNLASLTIAKAAAPDSRVGFRVDLSYGAGTALIAGRQSAQDVVTQNVQQAYGSYILGAAHPLELDAGKFVTPAGLERIDPRDDWNASRSLLFTLAIPHDHMGLRAVYAPSSRLTVTGFVANGWSDVAANPDGKNVGVAVNARPVSGVAVEAAYIGGPETTVSSSGWRDLSDVAITARVTPNFSLAVNGDAGTDRSTLQSWQGIAAYLRWQADGVAITPRLEALRDHDGFLTGVSQDLQEATVTAEFKPARAPLVRFEYRIDVTDRPYFLRGVSTTVRTQSIVVAQCVIGFGTHEPDNAPPRRALSALRNQ